MPDYQMVRIKDIDRRPEAQIRVAVNAATVKEYRGLIEEGVEFDPVFIVQMEDGANVLADGWHRCLAHEKAGHEKIKAVVEQGTMADVLRVALERNRHGEKLTRADKANAVKMLLATKEFRRMSDRALGKMANVSPGFVATVRSGKQEKPAVKAEAPALPAKPQPTGNTKRDGGVPEPNPQPVVAHERKPDNAKPAKIDTFEEKVKTVRDWMKQGYLDLPALCLAAETKSEKLVPVLKEGQLVEIFGSGESHWKFAAKDITFAGGVLRVEITGDEAPKQS